MKKTNADVCLATYLAAKPYVKQFRTAIDIGCRDADFSRPMSKDFIRVKAFDYRRRPGFQDLKNVLHFAIALGDEQKTVTAYSGVILDNPSDIKGNAREKQVEQRTLDSFYFDTVDLIKIDVEGHEYRVLKGAKKTIDKCSPTIIIEVNGSDEKWGKETGAIDYLKEMGYEVKTSYGADLILTRKI